MKLLYLRQLSFIVFFSLLSATLVSAQKYSNEFLNIGVSARAQAMGNSVIASVDDVTSGYWNPAGLAAFSTEKKLQLGAMHAEWFGGVGKFDYLAATLPLAAANRRIGVSLIRFGIDGIPNTLSLFDDDGTVHYDRVTEFSAADYAMLFSYAQALKTKSENSRLLIGGNVKIVRRVIGSFANSWGFGIDLGLQYHLKNWRFGFVGRDVTSTFNAWNVTFTESEKEVLLQTQNELPDVNSTEVTKPQFILGAAYGFKWNDVKLLPEMNYIITTDGPRNVLFRDSDSTGNGAALSMDMSVGMELNYKDFIFLRGGVNQFQRETDFDDQEFLTARPSVGVGLKISSLKIDYAFTDVGDSQNRFSHVVSLILDIKPKRRDN